MFNESSTFKSINKGTHKVPFCIGMWQGLTFPDYLEDGASLKFF